jgi:hypothetical protein
MCVNICAKKTIHLILRNGGSIYFTFIHSFTYKIRHACLSTKMPRTSYNPTRSRVLGISQKYNIWFQYFQITKTLRLECQKNIAKFVLFNYFKILNFLKIFKYTYIRWRKSQNIFPTLYIKWSGKFQIHRFCGARDTIKRNWLRGKWASIDLDPV